MKVGAHKFPVAMLRRLGQVAEQTGTSRGEIVRAGVARELAFREAAAGAR